MVPYTLCHHPYGITNQSLDVITGFPELELLHLGGTKISNTALPRLYGLKKLRTLFATRLGVNHKQAEALKDAMPWIERLEY